MQESRGPSAVVATSANPLRRYFDGVTSGPGIWKWLHYLDLYDRHLRKFVGQQVVVVEVGVFSGGSLPMWHDYFGARCHVHGIDIEPACMAYQSSQTTIHIGDQARRGFWRSFREQVPIVHVFIDDGGHQPEQQMVTIEEMLPHLQPGGVYICEDVHGVGNPFTAFTAGMLDQLQAWKSLADPRAYGSVPSAAQRAIDSLHLYPFSVVIELREQLLNELDSARRGSKWQPFL